jgi:hypothetical protein
VNDGSEHERIELVVAVSRRRPAASAAPGQVAVACRLNILIIRNICRSSGADG